VLSPEKVVVTFRLATIGNRLVAGILDLIVASIVMIIVLLGLSTIGIVGLQIGAVLSSFGIFIYFIAFESLWNGQTLGKKALGIQTRMADGTPLTVPAAFFRAMLIPADYLPPFFLVGMMAMFSTPKSQRIGDLLANTVVVATATPVFRFTAAPHKYGVHPFEDQMPPLRGMTSEEYIALKRLCDRFPSLPESIQNRMIVEIWNPLAEKYGIQSVSNVHPVYLMEATVMKYSRIHGLL